MKQKTRGFTLIEILVVLAIVSALAAILFPVMGHVREKGRQTTCQSNLKQISLGMLQYLQDNNSHFPPFRPGFRLRQALTPYAKNPILFICPADPEPEINSDTYSSYEIYDWVDEVDFKAGRIVGRVYGRNEAEVANTSTTPSLFELIGDEEKAKRHVSVDGTCTLQYEAGVRHFDGLNYAFVDGHVKWLSAYAADELLCSQITSAKNAK